MESALRRLRRLVDELRADLERHGTDPAGQIALTLQYRELARRGDPAALPSFRDVGFRVRSQTDEDGILLFLFGILGTTNRTCVELCAGDAAECNTANLLLHHHWSGLLVDGDRHLVERARARFARHRGTYVDPPQVVHAWLTRDTINDVLRRHGIDGEVDLLSLDVDGVEYWLWDALDAISPRVVVIEYQDILGPDRVWTVPYADGFRAETYPMTDGMPNFAGASLAALTELGTRKGYRLVGTNCYGYNAFFVRNDVGPSLLPAVEVASCFGHPKTRRGMRERFPTVAHLPWVDLAADGSD